MRRAARLAGHLGVKCRAVAPNVLLRLSAQPRLAALLPEGFVKVVERLAAALNPPRIVIGGCADAIDQRPDAGNLGATELVILEVDVVDDLGDRAQGRVLEA